MDESRTTKAQVESGSPRYHVFLLLLLATVLLYLATVSFLHRFNKNVVPRGDPFTYTIGFFHVVDSAHVQYTPTLRDVVTGRSWYWLQHILVTVLSPLLVKEPESIVLINFVVFFLATASLFRLVKQLGATTPVAFLLSFTIWLGPFLYALDSPASVFVLQLDTTFLGMLFVALVNLVLFAIRPLETKQGILAGLTAGLALWGRGNSLPYVLIAACCPLIILAWGIVTGTSPERKKRLANLLLFLAVLSVMGCWYYKYTLEAIREYYSFLQVAHADASGITEKVRTLFHPPSWVTNDIPGVFFDPAAPDSFAGHSGSLAIKRISWAIHLLVLSSILFAFTRRGQGTNRLNVRALRIACASGALVYGAVFLLSLLVAQPLHECRLYHPFDPMLAGLALCAVCLIAPPLIARGEASYLKSGAFMPIVVLVAVLYGWWWTQHQFVAKQSPGLDTPADVERFALNLDHYLKNRQLAVVWYQMYNPAILQYYRYKNDQPDYPLFDKYNYFFWHPIAEQIPCEDFRDALRKTMQEADYVIIPEDLQNYAKVFPCSLRRYGAKEMGDFLDSPDCPRYAIRETIHDCGCRLFLLERLKPEDSAEGCRLLPRPYRVGVSGSIRQACAEAR